MHNESFSHYFRCSNTSVVFSAVDGEILVATVRFVGHCNNTPLTSDNNEPNAILWLHNNVIVITFLIAVFWPFRGDLTSSSDLFWTCSLFTFCVCVRVCPDLLSDLMQNRSWTQQVSVSNYRWLLVWEETETDLLLPIKDGIFLQKNINKKWKNMQKVTNNPVANGQKTHIALALHNKFASSCTPIGQF